MKTTTVWRWPSTWGYLVSVLALLLSFALRSCSLALSIAPPLLRATAFQERIERLRAHSEPYLCRGT